MTAGGVREDSLRCLFSRSLVVRFAVRTIFEVGTVERILFDVDCNTSLLSLSEMHQKQLNMVRTADPTSAGTPRKNRLPCIHNQTFGT
jgi:hypothetical protein